MIRLFKIIGISLCIFWASAIYAQPDPRFGENIIFLTIPPEDVAVPATTDSGQPIDPNSPVTKTLYPMEITSDGRYVIGAMGSTYTNALYLWDLVQVEETGAMQRVDVPTTRIQLGGDVIPLYPVDHPGVRTVGFSPDETLVFLRLSDKVQFFTMPDLTAIDTFAAPEGSQIIATDWAQEENTLAIIVASEGTDERSIVLWADGETTLISENVPHEYIGIEPLGNDEWLLTHQNYAFTICNFPLDHCVDYPDVKGSLVINPVDRTLISRAHSPADDERWLADAVYQIWSNTGNQVYLPDNRLETWNTSIVPYNFSPDGQTLVTWIDNWASWLFWDFETLQAYHGISSMTGWPRWFPDSEHYITWRGSKLDLRQRYPAVRLDHIDLEEIWVGDDEYDDYGVRDVGGVAINGGGNSVIVMRGDSAFVIPIVHE